MRFRISSLFRTWLALVSLTFVLAFSAASKSAAKSAASPTPTPTPLTVDFQATAEVDNVEIGRPIDVQLNFTNKSEQTLTISEITLSSQSFSITNAPSGKPYPTPSPNAALQATGVRVDHAVGPFQTFTDSLAITAKESAPFTQNKLILTAKYSWMSGQQKFESAQLATLTIEVRRRFEEEAKGLPGGTAAILYLLLPILPALFSYQLVNRRRKNQGWQVPTFGADQILPAFFLAVLFSLIIIWRTKAHREIDYSNYRTLLIVILLSAVAGALIPTVRWLIDSVRRAIYDFKDKDTADKYLLRALRGRHSKGGFVWAKGTVSTQQWQGMLFHQIDGSPVLGATIQIKKGDNVSAQQWTAIKRSLFGMEDIDEDDESAKHVELRDPKYLRKLINEKKVKVGKSANKVQVGTGYFEVPVVVNAVKNLSIDPPTEHHAIVRPVD